MEEVLELWHKLLGELHSLLLKILHSQLRKKLEQICLKSLLQRLGKLLVDIKTRNICKIRGNRNSSEAIGRWRKEIQA